MATAKLSDFLNPKKHPIQVFIEENKEMLDLIYGDRMAFVDKCRECARDGKPIRVEWEEEGLPSFCDPRTYTDYVPERTCNMVPNGESGYAAVLACSVCGNTESVYAISSDEFNYCPNCGAKVVE